MDTQMHIRMFHPQSTRQCLVLGRLYERAHPRKPYKEWSSGKGSTISSGGKGLLSTPKLSETTNKENTQQPNKLRKFLTNEEMSERRAKGLCYYCDEKFSPEHYLKHKKTQLFLIDLRRVKFNMRKRWMKIMRKEHQMVILLRSR